jgi:uncharacterized protein YkwD
MDQPRRQAAPARRVRLAAFGLIALAVLAGGSLYLARGVFSAGPAPAATSGSSARTTAAGCGAAASVSCAGDAADVAMAGPPAVVTAPPGHAAASAHPSATRPAPHPSAAASTASVAPGTPATGPGSPQASAPASTSGAGATEDSLAAAQVLALINQARATAGLPALTISAGLETTSSAHNLRMADGCGLSHQCPGEPAIGDRETAAGVNWTAAGENIGDGGPVAGTSAAIAQMAVGLTQSMLDEQPPNDGHRMNILSSSYTHIGIAVYRDSSGTVWLTQDFSN